MRVRYFAVALLSIGFTSSVSAQGIGPGELGGGLFGGLVDGLVGLIGTLTGIRVEDPTTALGIAAVLGVMMILVYLPIKLGAKRLDIEDSVLGTEGSTTSSGSRNLAAILSVLITLSTIPTGFFELLIVGYGTLSVLIGLLMLVLVTYATIKFFGTGVSGIGSVSSALGEGLEADAKGLEADVKEAEASNLDAEAEALEKENQARERYKSAVEDLEDIEDEVEGAEAEAEDGGESGSGDEEQEAVERIRNALNALRDESDHFPDELEKDKEMLDEAIKDAKKELSLENDIDKGIIDLHKRIQRVKIYLEESEGKLANQFSSSEMTPQWLNLITGHGDYQDIQDVMSSEGVMFDVSKGNGKNALKNTPAVTSDNYGLYEVIADLERAEEEIQLIEKELYNIDPGDTKNEGLTQEFKDLLYATESATDFAHALNKMKEVLREVHTADEEIEEICSENDWKELYDAADQNESIESQLMNRINNLSDTESELNNKIEEAHQLLKKQVIGTDEILSELKDLSGDTGGMVSSGDNPLNNYAVDLRDAAITDEGDRLVDVSPVSSWDASADGFEFTVDISGKSFVELATDEGDGLLDRIVQDTDEIKAPLVEIAHEVNQEDHEEHDVLEEIEAHLNSG